MLSPGAYCELEEDAVPAPVPVRWYRTRNPFSTSASPRPEARWHLALSGRAEQEHVRPFPEPDIAARQHAHSRLRHRRDEGEVEGLQRLARRQLRLGPVPLEALALAVGDLVAGERGEQAGGGPPVAVGAVGEAFSTAPAWSAGAVCLSSMSSWGGSTTKRSLMRARSGSCPASSSTSIIGGEPGFAALIMSQGEQIHHPAAAPCGRRGLRAARQRRGGRRRGPADIRLGAWERLLG